KKEVTDLLASSTEACLRKGLFEIMVCDPESEDALIHPAKLPRTSKHSAPVNDRAQSVGVNILLNDELRGQLRRSIQRSWKISRKIFANAFRCNAWGALSVRYFK